MNGLITSETQRFAVIGDPISHSLSPVIHNLLYNKMSLDRVYLTLRIPPQQLKDSIELLRNNFSGINVTIPHKEAILEYLDEIDEGARLYGAVNTVKVKDGRLKGYNTDGYGFTMSLESEGVNLKGKRVLVLGAGGAARVIIYELLNIGAEVFLANRNLDRGYTLKNEIEVTITGKSIKILNIHDVDEDYYCIINTTPVGMGKILDELPIEEEIVERAKIVFDLIYNPFKTKILTIAEAKGCKIINGLRMLYFQAIRAQEIWLEKKINPLLIEEVYQEFMMIIKG